MKLAEFLEKRKNLEAQKPQFRKLCRACRQPDFSCYCQTLTQFDPNIEFIILIHPLEAKRRIATGRMAHLCLKNSRLIEGHNYSDNEEVNDLLNRGDAEKFILYPGPQAINLTEMKDSFTELFPANKKLIVFVIDGTWATARQTMNVSLNLKTLPRICFTPSEPSRFRVRRQPKIFCYSTIEAIHHTIDLFGHTRGFDAQKREHDQLIKSFDWMVEKQLELMKSTATPRRVMGKPTWRTKSRKLKALLKSGGQEAKFPDLK